MTCLANNSSTTSKRSLWPPEHADKWVISLSGGSKLTLSDLKVYDDWASGLGTNTLGYTAYIAKGADYFVPTTSLPWQLEHDFASQFCQAMGTESVRFVKNGSDALAMAVRLARAYTNRSYVQVFDQCYHGVAESFAPIIWSPNGYEPSVQVIKQPFGEEIRSGLLDKTAAIVVEPVPKSILVPPDGWLQHLREVCNEHGILLISDEVVLGYRHTLRGYMPSLGIDADLYCYGKAMGQGAAIAGCTGPQNIMRLLEKDVHYSNTNNGEWLPLAVAQWTLDQYQTTDVCKTLALKGNILQKMLMEAGFSVRGLAERFEVVFDNPAQRMEATRFCWANNILFPGFCSLAVTHTEEQMYKLVEALTNWRNTQ